MWLLLVIGVAAVAWYIARSPRSSERETHSSALDVDAGRYRNWEPEATWPVRPDRFGHFDIPGVGYFANSAFTASGRYFLGFSDGHGEVRGGKTIWKKGVVALMDESGLVWKKAVRRPLCGAVADDGTVIIGDPQDNQLKSRLYVWNVVGDAVIDHVVEANFWNCALSPDGSIAVAQTCNNRRNNDGNALLIFDTRQKVLLAQTPNRTGWSDGYSFDMEQRVVTLTNKDGATWRYGLDGIFLDEKAEGVKLAATPNRRRSGKRKGGVEGEVAL